MDIDYEHFLNGICNSLKHRDRIFRKFERELKHKLIFSTVSEPIFDDDDEIIVNFHFNGFRQSSEIKNHWEFRFYMYAENRGVEYISRHEEQYQELLKGLHDKVLEMAKMDQIMRSINS